jgi:hypothetical protein
MTSSDEWYERERAAFIAWWEADEGKKFSGNPTLAAGAAWFARAESLLSEIENRKCPRCGVDEGQECGDYDAAEGRCNNAHSRDDKSHEEQSL